MIFFTTMAAPLTEDDNMYCFEIAGVIWNAASTASIHDGYGVQLSLTDINLLQNDLTTRLNALSATAVQHVQDLIVQWKNVRLSVAELETGSVGDMGGIKYSPEKRRENIKEIFGSITGCIGMAQAILHKKRAAEGADRSVMIGVQRG